ncbi:transposable element Tcb1 transposase [Trichonephila clavipes]|nr:transposable element Tcb1 transposase [Trichonephila clavipes]
MVTAYIGKAISAATVRLRLRMNVLYARVPRVGVPLSIQSRGTRLKRCREHGNLNASDWGNAMFTDESRFSLEPDDKRIRQCFSNCEAPRRAMTYEGARAYRNKDLKNN